MINAYDGTKTEPWFDDFGDFNTVRPQGDALYKESMREMSDKIVEDYMAKEPYYLEWKAWVEEAYPGQTIGPMSTSEFNATLNSTWVNDFNKAVGMKPTVAIADDVGVKLDGDKPRYDLEQVLATEEVMKVLTYGANKYSADNWRLVPDFEKRYYSASRRHIASYMRGELIDPESGLSHLAHAITCLSYILEIQLENKQSQE
jgi:hypothetical protein